MRLGLLFATAFLIFSVIEASAKVRCANLAMPVLPVEFGAYRNILTSVWHTKMQIEKISTQGLNPSKEFAMGWLQESLVKHFGREAKALEASTGFYFTNVARQESVNLLLANMQKIDVIQISDLPFQRKLEGILQALIDFAKAEKINLSGRGNSENAINVRRLQNMANLEKALFIIEWGGGGSRDTDILLAIASLIKDNAIREQHALNSYDAEYARLFVNALDSTYERTFEYGIARAHQSSQINEFRRNFDNYLLMMAHETRAARSDNDLRAKQREALKTLAVVGRSSGFDGPKYTGVWLQRLRAAVDDYFVAERKTLNRRNPENLLLEERIENLLNFQTALRKIEFRGGDHATARSMEDTREILLYYAAKSLVAIRELEDHSTR